MSCVLLFFFFQAEDGIRYLVRSRGLGDVYKRQRSILSAFVMLLVAGLVSPVYAQDAGATNTALVQWLSLIHI